MRRRAFGLCVCGKELLRKEVRAGAEREKRDEKKQTAVEPGGGGEENERKF